MTIPGYLSYKRTESGRVAQIPEHWSDGRLKDVLAASVTDGPHTTPEFLADGVPFLSVDAIQNGELVLEGSRFISADDHTEFRRKAAPMYNDLLMGKAASTGKIARVKTEVEFSIWSPLALIRIDKKKASPSYIEYALKSTSVQAEIDNYCTANTQKNIGMVDIPKLRIVRPPLVEQRQIADYLDAHAGKIDELIEKQERLIETLAERRQAVISHAVTKGLDPNAPMKDSGVDWLGEAPFSWPIVKVGYAYSVTVGKMLNAGQVPEDGEVVPYLRAANIQPEGLDLREVKQMIVSAADSRSLELCRNDVVVVEGGGGYGRSDVLRDDLPGWVFQNHVLRVRPRRGDSSDFFNYLMKTINSNGHVASLSNHATIPSISSEKLASVRLGLPEVAVQNSIVVHLDRETAQIDALSAKAREMICILKERRQALISAAVTGKIDVRGLS